MLIYKKKFGTAMGSPMSVTVANLVMEEVEERALKSYHTKIAVRRRYVDDTFTVVPQDLTEDFHMQINSTERIIKFTKRTEEGGKISFLDVMVSREKDGTFKMEVQYLNYHSSRPLEHKEAVATALFRRAKSHSSDLATYAEKSKGL